MKALAGWKRWLVLAAAGTALAASLAVVALGGTALLARARAADAPNDWPLVARIQPVGPAGQVGLPGCNLVRGQVGSCPMFGGRAADGAPAWRGEDGAGVPPVEGGRFGCH